MASDVTGEKPWTRLKSELYSIMWASPRSNKRLISFAALSPTAAVLDIGCGPGAAVRRAARIVTSGSATGVDPSPGMVAIARRRSKSVPNATFELGTAEALPFDGASFTHVLSIHSFHHWADEKAGLGECLRVLRPAGRAYLAETLGRGDHRMTEARAADVADLVRAAGFAHAEVQRVAKEIVVIGTKAE